MFILICLVGLHVVTTDTSEVTNILFVPSSFHLIDFCLVLSIHALPLEWLKVTNTDTKQDVNLQLVNFKLCCRTTTRMSHHGQPRWHWRQQCLIFLLRTLWRSVRRGRLISYIEFLRHAWRDNFPRLRRNWQNSRVIHSHISFTRFKTPLPASMAHSSQIGEHGVCNLVLCVTQKRWGVSQSVNAWITCHEHQDRVCYKRFYFRDLCFAYHGAWIPLVHICFLCWSDLSRTCSSVSVSGNVFLSFRAYYLIHSDLWV